MKNVLFFFLFVFTVTLFLSIPCFSQISDTVGVVDTLRVGNSTAYPGSQVIVPLFAFNDEPLGAMTVPLNFSSSDLTCDSVSFVGTRVADAGLKGGEIDNQNRTVKIYAVSFTQIAAGSGLVAKLFFTVNQNASPQTVELDTFSTSNPFVFLDFTYTFSVDMTPVFVKGGINIKEKNLPPQLKAIGTQYVSEGDTLSIRIWATDPEGDSLRIGMLNSPEGASLSDSGNGRAGFRWAPPLTGPWSSVNSPFKVTFVVSDGVNSSREDVEINVIDKKSTLKDYVLEIGTDSGFYLDAVTVPIKLTNPDSVGSMKLLLHFDPSALFLLGVSKLNTRIGNWEYFQYQANVPAPGDLVITGIANIPDPTVTPPLPPGDGVIANLSFRVILDPSPFSLLTSLSYTFRDSTDNTFGGIMSQEFIPRQEISYLEGSVYIERLETDLGDINLNGIPYEIGDAVRFSNYLIDPVTYAFNEQQKVNSDVNEDGVCCSLADFILLLTRILGGGNAALAKILPQADSIQVNLERSSTGLDLFVDAEVSLGGGVLTIRHPGTELGEPALSPDAKDMTLLKKENPDELRLLFYSPTGKCIDSGKRRLMSIPVVSGDGNIDVGQAVFSDSSGNLLRADLIAGKIQEVPKRFELFQNYPNPFNPETRISFYLPEEAQVSLKIYNLRGQLIRELVNQKMSPGVHSLTWDGKDTSGKDVASGIYFYKVMAAEYSATKKMIRVK